MKDLLNEVLKEYLDKFKQNQSECLDMIKNKVEDSVWKEHAKKGAGLKLMIEATLIELKQYETNN